MPTRLSLQTSASSSECVPLPHPFGAPPSPPLSHYLPPLLPSSPPLPRRPQAPQAQFSNTWEGEGVAPAWPSPQARVTSDDSLDDLKPIPWPSNFVPPLPAVLEVPLLPDDEWPRGNVRVLQRGVRRPIGMGAADRLKEGCRDQRAGLLYDESAPGFEPIMWPHVIALSEGESFRVSLEGEREGEIPQLVDVCYNPDADPRLLGIGEHWLSVHDSVREGDLADGGMVGVGAHLSYEGVVKDFVTESRSAEERCRVANGMEVAGKCFKKHFEGRGVGFEELLAEQKRLMPERPAWPVCWACSGCLGNAAHFDRDCSRSFAVWVARRPGASGSWWFLFPRHGLAVALCHGTFISWDGRQQTHCTSSPQLGAGDNLVSLYAGLYADMKSVRERVLECDAELRERKERSGMIWGRLREGMVLAVRYVPAAPATHVTKRQRKRWAEAHKRWVEVTVESIHREPSLPEMYVTVCDAEGDRKRWTLTRRDVENLAVICE